MSLDKSYAGRRCVLKFSMDVDIARQAGTRRAIVISVANLGMAESHHFEVRLPHELIISSFTVISADASIAPTANVDGSIGHLHFGRLSERFPEGEVIAEVAPRTGGPLTLAGWSTLCVSLFAAASIPARIFDRWFFPEGVEIPSTAVSLVLAIATAILSRHVWSHRHEVSAAVFSPSTKIQTANLITLVAIALLSSLPVTPLLWHIFWGLAYLSSGLAVWVYFANTRATKRSLIEEGSGNGRT